MQSAGGGIWIEDDIDVANTAAGKDDRVVSPEENVVTRRRQSITDTLRRRILAAIRAGALRGGDRLPSTREAAADLDADPRVVAEAYRALAAEALVELRPRSGVFVAPVAGAEPGPPKPGAAWLSGVIADGVCRGVPVLQLADVIAAATRSRTAAAAVIAPTLDQALGLARELSDQYGVHASGLLDEQIARGEAPPRAVARANVLVGTRRTAALVRRLGERLAKPAVVIDPCPDLLGPEWRLLLRGPVYVVVADPRFRALVHEFVSEAEGAHEVRVLVAGRDDLSEIGPDVPTYVTDAARQRLGRTRLPGRLVAPVRMLCDDSVRELAHVLVQHNLAAPRRPARGCPA